MRCRNDSLKTFWEIRSNFIYLEGKLRVKDSLFGRNAEWQHIYLCLLFTLLNPNGFSEMRGIDRINITTNYLQRRREFCV